MPVTILFIILVCVKGVGDDEQLADVHSLCSIHAHVKPCAVVTVWLGCMTHHEAITIPRRRPLMPAHAQVVGVIQSVLTEAAAQVTFVNIAAYVEAQRASTHHSQAFNATIQQLLLYLYQPRDSGPNTEAAFCLTSGTPDYAVWRCLCVCTGCVSFQPRNTSWCFAEAVH